MSSKITSLHYSLVKKSLYNPSFNCWKVTPSFLIKSSLGQNFLFHSNLSRKPKIVCKFPKFYEEILRKSRIFLSSFSNILPIVASQVVWFNKCKMDNSTIFESNFSKKILIILVSFLKTMVDKRTEPI